MSSLEALAMHLEHIERVKGVRKSSLHVSGRLKLGGGAVAKEKGSGDSERGSSSLPTEPEDMDRTIARVQQRKREEAARQARRARGPTRGDAKRFRR